MTYPEFIVENYLHDVYHIRLDQPKLADGSRASIKKLGPFVQVAVQAKVYAIYSRSVELFLTFEDFDIKGIFYTPDHKGPVIVQNEIYNKICKLVNKTMFENGKEEWIREEYRKKTELFNAKIAEVVGKIKELDEKHDSQNYLQD
jgi:hypothetical protein